MQLPTLSPTILLEDVGARLSTTSRNGARIKIQKTTRGMVVEEFAVASNPSELLWNTLLRFLGLTNGASVLTALITTDTMSVETYESLVNQTTTRIEDTYDLLNVGLKNSFSLRRGLAHNCGYGMGHPKFKADVYKKEGLVITDEMAKITIDTYRRVNHEVVALWNDLENAFKKAILGQSSMLCSGKIHVTPMPHPWKGVQIRLPSGNHLYYHYAHLKEEPVFYKEGEFAGQPIMRNGRQVTREVMVYLDNEGGRFEEKKVYGGLLTEHVTSCTARDIMVPAMWRLEQAGFEVLGTIHDELWAQTVDRIVS